MKIIFFANTDWYLYNFRRALARSVRQAGCDLLLLSPDGQYSARLREAGFDWRPAPMDRRSLNPLRELQLLWWLCKLFRKERPDLVHCFTIKCVIYGAIAARFAGIEARVNSVAGMGYVFTSSGPRARILRPVVRTLMRLLLGGGKARLILQNSDDVSLFLASRLVDGSRVRLIKGSGVDCSRFTARADASAWEGGRPARVLVACRLLWDKGIAEYIAAARKLKRERRPIHFLLAGESDPGNPAAVPHAYLREWVSEGAVEWLGHVDDMRTLLASVDIVALPSYREGLPKGLIEAAACGLPIVTTDVPGCREVVTDGVDGLLVPAGDADALASAIARLAENPRLAASMGKAARQKAMAEFAEEKVVGATMDVYREISLFPR